MRVTVSADLPLDAQAYLLERDGAAFRSFMCEEVSRSALQHGQLRSQHARPAATMSALP